MNYSVSYNGIEYPTRMFEVYHSGDMEWKHSYQIAPESLLDAMHKKEGEDATSLEGEAWRVDKNIYHYVEDAIFELSASVICAECLDIPMILIEESI